MKIKNRIWSLPTISACIIAVSSYFSTKSLHSIQQTGLVDYPMVARTASVRAEVKAVVDDLQTPVPEGDKKRLTAIDERVVRLRKDIETLSAIDGQAQAGQRLMKEQNAYYAAARLTARIMLELETGDPAPAIATMQSGFEVLTADLDKTVLAAQNQFNARLALSAESVKAALTASITIAVIVILMLAGIAHFVVRALWEQLGGEPEHARSMAHAVAQGTCQLCSKPTRSIRRACSQRSLKCALGSRRSSPASKCLRKKFAQPRAMSPWAALTSRNGWKHRHITSVRHRCPCAT